jgi:hypothetical protein
MKAENLTTDHNRTIRLTGIPSKHPHDPVEMLITINYIHKDGDGSAVIDKAVTLDSTVIPAIINAINAAN